MPQGGAGRFAFARGEGGRPGGITVGPPVRCMVAGVPTEAAANHARFEGEALTQDRANWNTLWAASEAAVAEYAPAEKLYKKKW